MNKRLLFQIVFGAASLGMTQLPGRADAPQSLDAQISPHRLNILDRRGYFTPVFKKAVHDLVDAKAAVVAAQDDEKGLRAKLPALEAQVAEADDKMAKLHQQLADLDRTDETDFVALQQEMSDANAKPEDQRVSAQAYVWAYPASPHQADAQHYLEAVQKKIADQAQADADAEAAREAAHAKLVQRAQARDLSPVEWRDFLLNMSQEDLLKFLGPPQNIDHDYWVYSGAWTEDPITHQKVGLQINFNAGRVLNVTEKEY